MKFSFNKGFAIAEGVKVSGLEHKLNDVLLPLKDQPNLLILFLVCLLTQVVTEVGVNVIVAESVYLCHDFSRQIINNN